jgi:hypothetical protein
VQRCNEPATERCLGWNATLDAVECGPGYLQGSAGCGTCAVNYYRDSDDGRCKRCPNVEDAWTVIQLPLAFAGGLLVTGLVIFAFLLIVRCYMGGTVGQYAKRSAKFIAQVFVAVQVRRSAKGGGGGSGPALPRPTSCVRGRRWS